LVSIGVACQASMQEELDQLLSRADAALYQAKENGRDRIEIDATGAATVVRQCPQLEAILIVE
jgi:predicted signal transduction protein with EAL and GGDEF domain